MVSIRVIVGVFVVFAWSPALMAQISGRDRDQAEKMIEGDLYLRNNVPCRYVSGRWGGIGAEVVTEVSPTGIDWDKNLKLIEEERKDDPRSGVDTIYWGFGPNDVIRYGELSFDGETIELWAEGAEPKDTEIYIRFVQIKNLDDFQKALDLILAKKSIQDEHPEWPEEIRKAIAERKVVEGMDKDQVFAVVGTPLAVETRDEGGKEVELWVPRQDTGAAGGWGKVTSSSTGFPKLLRFIDGKLVSIV
jgi:hypothetical protein